jgi:hypothetical protein
MLQMWHSFVDGFWKGFNPPATLVKDTCLGSVVLKRGDKVRKSGGDYSFYGTVVAVFNKIGNPKAYRIVVEDSRGILLIMNPTQVEMAN